MLWNRSLERLPGGADGAPAASPIADKRFKSQEWIAHPGAAFLAEMYLLNARTLMQMADQVEADAKTKQRIRFAVQQWIDAASPSNYLALNPEAQRKAIETKGESLMQGLQHLWGENVLQNIAKRGLKVDRSVPVHGVIEPFNQMVANIKSKPS